MSGPWDSHYQTATEPRPYGDDLTYRLAAEWVEDCATVSDWGCGLGWLRGFIEPASSYTGIDASESPYADVIADLTEYRTDSEGIVLRHVLEHSYNWARILDNALESFTKRLCVVLFTPLTDAETVLLTEPEYGDVPVISFALRDLHEHIPAAMRVEVETIASPSTEYGVETLLRIAR